MEERHRGRVQRGDALGRDEGIQLSIEDHDDAPRVLDIGGIRGRIVVGTRGVDGVVGAVGLPEVHLPLFPGEVRGHSGNGPADKCIVAVDHPTVRTRHEHLPLSSSIRRELHAQAQDGRGAGPPVDHALHRGREQPVAGHAHRVTGRDDRGLPVDLRIGQRHGQRSQRVRTRHLQGRAVGGEVDAYLSTPERRPGVLLPQLDVGHAQRVGIDARDREFALRVPDAHDRLEPAQHGECHATVVSRLEISAVRRVSVHQRGQIAPEKAQ